MTEVKTINIVVKFRVCETKKQEVRSFQSSLLVSALVTLFRQDRHIQNIICFISK